MDFRLLRRLLYPKIGWVILLTFVSSVGLLVILGQELNHTATVYIVYLLSAYALVIVSARFVHFCKMGKERLHQNAVFHRYSADLDFRAFVSGHLSPGVTLFYCTVKAAAGIYYHSAWFGSIAFYYIVLGLVRVSLLRYIRGGQNSSGQAYRRYRLCGYLLLALTAVLGVISFYVVEEGKAVHYPGYLIYAAAGYTFYNLTMAFYNLARYRELHNPVYSAGKILSLAGALVSVFFLQTAMLSAFGTGESWQRYINIGTNTAVSLVIVGMALFMIRRGNRAVARSEQEREKE